MRMFEHTRIVRFAALSAATVSSLVTGIMLGSPDGNGVSGRPVPAAPAGSISGEVHTLALTDTTETARGEESLRGGGARTAGTPATSTQRFSLLGVTWDDGRSSLGERARVLVRVRSAATGAWSAWSQIAAHSEDAPDRGTREGGRVRGGTLPLWVGPSTGVEVRATGLGRSLPPGLRVDLVDPDSDPPVERAPRSGEPSRAPGASAHSAPTTEQRARRAAEPVADGSTAPKPPMISRAGWNADESLVADPPEYTTAVKAVFVHHTDTGNGYTCAQSASVVRSIFLYHVKSNGWNDIGYNFLVDKCGTLFEGRAGGTDRPVKGAHTYGFNTDSAGVAVLGTFTDVAPPQAALDTAGRIAAWKVGLTGADPSGTTTLVASVTGKYKAGQSVSFKRISGHRDGFATECPGRRLYDRLAGIRTAAKAWVTPATTTTLTGISGATRVNGTYHTKGGVTLSWKPAAVSRHDVLVDGTVVASAGPFAASRTITLPAGAHQVRVRAANLNGTTALSPLYPVVADTARPVFGTPPDLAVRTGAMSASSLPVRLRWKATDDRSLYALKATKPSVKTFTAGSTSWSTSTRPGLSTLWSLTAADAAGNTTTASVTRKATVLSDASSTRSRSWKSVSASSYLGGKALSGGAKGAHASWTFTGRSAGLIVKQASNLGAFHVYVDGVKVATVDSRASTTRYRRIVWATGLRPGKHTVKIVVVGTAGRPTVVIDGLAFVG